MAMSVDVLDVVVTRASVERARGRMAGRFAATVTTVTGTVLADGLVLVDGLPAAAAVSGEQAGRSLPLQNVGRPAAAYYAPYAGEGAVAGGGVNGGSGSSAVAGGGSVPGVRSAVVGAGGDAERILALVWPLVREMALASRRVVNEDHSGECDGVRVLFTLANVFRASTVQVWVNGLLQRPGRDFVEVDGEQIEMAEAPLAGDDLLAAYELA